MQPASESVRFWKWFAANAEALRTAMYGGDPDARQNASAALGEAASEVQEGLVLELGPVADDGVKELIVSADGRREQVDAVKDFVATAPALEGWRVVAFRPRMEVGEEMEIAIEGERVEPADVWFRIEESDDGLDLTLHVRGLNEENSRLRGLGALLLAEHGVGERDAMTLLSSLQVEPLPDHPAAAGLRPFRELVGLFDKVKEKKYPPRGALPLDPEGEWQAMQGMIGDMPAVVLLNTALRRFAGHPDYDHCLVVAIPFEGVRDDGMPASEEEYLSVTELGDRIGEELQRDQESLLGVTVLNQGRRDLILYSSDPAAALRWLEAVQAEGTHQVELSIDRDTFWGVYRSFLPGG